MRIELILAFGAMTAATLFSRALLTVSVSKAQVSPFLERCMSYIPYAVLSALVTPYLIFPGNAERLSLINPWTIAGGLTLAVSYRTKNLILSVSIGIVVFFILGIFMQ